MRNMLDRHDLSGSAQEPAQSWDAQAYRRCLGQFATGVAVVTADSGGERAGITMNSFSSVSLDPPLVLWSIGLTSRSYSLFSTARHFAINVLSSGQIGVSRAFTSAADDKFADIAWSPGVTGAPILDGVVAVIECETEFTYPGGDHLVVVGRVRHFTAFPGEGLLFAQGRYAVAQDHPDAKSDAVLAEAQTQLVADPLPAKLFTSLYWAFNSMSENFGKHRQEMGLDLPQTRVLSQIYNKPDILPDELLRMTYLAQSVGEDAVNALIDRGEVLRDRQGRLSLSQKGRSRREKLARKEGEFEQLQTANMPREHIEIARSVLNQISSRLQS